ncbi:MAG: hypothetical protein ACOWWM_03095 [Desulfobacterales bacterium]
MAKWLPLTAGLVFLLAPIACTRHRVEVAPVEVKPIHITIDVNVKIDREIDNYFGDLFETEDKIRQQQSTNP